MVAIEEAEFEPASEGRVCGDTAGGKSSDGDSSELMSIGTDVVVVVVVLDQTRAQRKFMIGG